MNKDKIYQNFVVIVKAPHRNKEQISVNASSEKEAINKVLDGRDISCFEKISCRQSSYEAKPSRSYKSYLNK